MKNINLISSRERRGYTQEQLARMLGYKGKQSVANWENGYSTPTLEAALKISRILEEDIFFLFDYKVQDYHTSSNDKEVI